MEQVVAQTVFASEHTQRYTIATEGVQDKVLAYRHDGSYEDCAKSNHTQIESKDQLIPGNL